MVDKERSKELDILFFFLACPIREIFCYFQFRNQNRKFEENHPKIWENCHQNRFRLTSCSSDKQGAKIERVDFSGGNSTYRKKKKREKEGRNKREGRKKKKNGERIKGERMEKEEGRVKASNKVHILGNS